MSISNLTNQLSLGRDYLSAWPMTDDVVRALKNVIFKMLFGDTISTEITKFSKNKAIKNLFWYSKQSWNE